MAEGVAEPGGAVVDVGEGEKGRPPRPAEDPERAPKGWIWDGKAKQWRPAKRVARRSAEDASPGGGTEPDWSAERDPEPARLADDHHDKSGRPASRKEISKEDRDDLEAVLAFAGAVLLPPVARADPICGGAALESWDQVCSSLVPIIAKSSSLAEWMTRAGGFRDWIALGAALRPIGTAVVRHHVFKTVGHEDEEQGATEEDWSRYAA